MDNECGRARNKLKANLEIALDYANERTCKSRHGCSSLEQNNDKELDGEGWNQPRDEEPSGAE